MMQCVIFVGGLGSRLGELVNHTPKPLLPVGGKPFLVFLLHEIRRFGFSRFLLLAGYKSEKIDLLSASLSCDAALRGVSIEVVTESEPLGTGGALLAAKHHLDDVFLLCNGDSFCDCNLLSLTRPFLNEGTLCRLGLCTVPDSSRYGEVCIENNTICAFKERGQQHSAGFINAGMYFMHKSLVSFIPQRTCSLEKDVFPALAQQRKLEFYAATDAFFLDIGIPEDFQRAQTLVPGMLHRAAAFFDLTLLFEENPDTKEKMWRQGAQESIFACNTAGLLVFVFSPFVEEREGERVPHWQKSLQKDLRKIDAHVDAFIPERCLLPLMQENVRDEHGCIVLEAQGRHVNCMKSFVLFADGQGHSVACLSNPKKEFAMTQNLFHSVQILLS